MAPSTSRSARRGRPASQPESSSRTTENGVGNTGRNKRRRPSPSSKGATLALVRPHDATGIMSMEKNEEEEDARMVVHAHRVTVSSVVPPPDRSRSSSFAGLRHEASVAFGRGLGELRHATPASLSDYGATTDLPAPWEPVRYHDFYHTTDYQVDTKTVKSLHPKDDLEESSKIPTTTTPHSAAHGGCRVKQGATHVDRSCTVMALSSSRQHAQNNDSYLALGDTAGYVSIYSMTPLILAVGRLETTASRREYQDDQQILNDTTTSKPDDSTPTASASAQAPAKETETEATTNKSTSGDPTPASDEEEGKEKELSSSTSKQVTMMLSGATRGVERNPTLASQSPNAIEALAFTASGATLLCICVSTKVEIELISCLDNTILFRMPVQSPAIRLDCHPHADHPHSILAGFSLAPINTATSENELHKLPLWRLDETTTDTNETATAPRRPLVSGIIPMEPIDGETTAVMRRPISIGPKSVAIWDCSNPERILMICLNLSATTTTTTSANSSSSQPAVTEVEQELLLLDASSGIIRHRSHLPCRLSGHKLVVSEALSQSHSGKYTLVAGIRGIRLYETDTLGVLQIYGEGISLHGHGIVWQDVFLSHQKTTNETGFTGPLGRTSERSDEVQYRQDQCSNRTKKTTSMEEESLEDLWIVGIPHAFREPLDLIDVVHFWEAVHPSMPHLDRKLPTLTLKAPPKSRGIVTLLCHDGGDEPKFVVSTQSGDCQQLLPTLKSDWPGIMYPPGYNVISENLTYIEDEDELDFVIRDDHFHEDAHNVSPRQSMLHGESKKVNGDTEMMEAMKQSLADNAYSEQAAVNVVDGENGSPRHRNCVIPCHPELYLQQRIGGGDLANGTNAPSDAVGAIEDGLNTTTAQNEAFSGAFFSLFPQIQEVREATKEQFERETGIIQELEATTITSVENDAATAETSNARGKRTKPSGRTFKTGSIEAMLNASVDPRIKEAMRLKERWADGTGSCLRERDIRTETLSQSYITADGSPKEIIDTNQTQQILTDGKEAGDVAVHVTPKARINSDCPACHGRMTYHKCGLKHIPIDHDAIDRAKKEKKEAEEEIKRQARLAKKRVTDAKRRDAKRIKKEEEQAARDKQKELERQKLLEKKAKDEEEQRIAAEFMISVLGRAPPPPPPLSSLLQHKDGIAATDEGIGITTESQTVGTPNISVAEQEIKNVVQQDYTLTIEGQERTNIEGEMLANQSEREIQVQEPKHILDVQTYPYSGVESHVKDEMGDGSVHMGSTENIIMAQRVAVEEKAAAGLMGALERSNIEGEMLANQSQRKIQVQAPKPILDVQTYPYSGGELHVKDEMRDGSVQMVSTENVIVAQRAAVEETAAAGLMAVLGRPPSSIEEVQNTGSPTNTSVSAFEVKEEVQDSDQRLHHEPIQETVAAGLMTVAGRAPSSIEEVQKTGSPTNTSVSVFEVKQEGQDSDQGLHHEPVQETVAAGMMTVAGRAPSSIEDVQNTKPSLNEIVNTMHEGAMKIEDKLQVVEEHIIGVKQEIQGSDPGLVQHHKPLKE